MENIVRSEIFILTLVLGVYVSASMLYHKTKLSILHPILLSIPALVGLMYLLDIPYETFRKGSHLIHFMLGPSVVVLGYLLYEQVDHLRQNMVSILTSVFVGSVVGILSVVYIGNLFGADWAIIASLEPKSVTTPIAMGIAERSGGLPSVAAVIVVVVGIFGGVVGPFILEKIGITSKVAKGLALGSAAHGLGTARAMELGSLEGAISGLAIGVMGVMTAVLVPIIELFIK